MQLDAMGDGERAVIYAYIYREILDRAEDERRHARMLGFDVGGSVPSVKEEPGTSKATVESLRALQKAMGK